jgi:flagellar basal-body rod protein FlgC
MDLLKVSASALDAHRVRMNTIASNMANAQSTRTEALFRTVSVGSDPTEKLDGVKVTGVVEDTKPPIVIYDPGHPDADDNGNVTMPNINVIEEMVNMMMALRSYEANVKAFNISKGMFQKSLEIGRM